MSPPTEGLPAELVAEWRSRDLDLHSALCQAERLRRDAIGTRASFLDLDESAQRAATQENLLNFYEPGSVNPYVALAACGPWVVTTAGAVVYDAGGYGMLGFGHTPRFVLEHLGEALPMANVMTPSLAQKEFTEALLGEIGHTRGACPFARFACLNSGSEAMSFATRLADINARQMTDAGGRHAGAPIRRLALEGSFHGRTERPAHYSLSSRPAYRAHLASFRHDDHVVAIAPNDSEALHDAFDAAERAGAFIEAFVMEPVMGEGNPGLAIAPEFYAAARERTQAHGSLLIVDSIQAGLRAHGVLSVVDYPGFQGLPAPDAETYSKALNAGQYPLSVVALTARAAALYRPGLYGNTMTSNPRALTVGTAVLGAITPALRENIRTQGQSFLQRLRALQREMPAAITAIQGTGLLFSCELSSDYRCYGEGSTEEWLRRHGYGVIHGGERSLRFTPRFAVTGDEASLLVEGIRQALRHGPRQK